MTHTLTVRASYATVSDPSIPARVSHVSGYIGFCECGKRSPEVASPQLARAWHEYHVDPTGRKARARG